MYTFFFWGGANETFGGAPAPLDIGLETPMEHPNHSCGDSDHVASSFLQ